MSDMMVFHTDDVVRYIEYHDGSLRALEDCYGVVQETQEGEGTISVKWFFKDGSTDFTKVYPENLIHYEDIMMFIAWKIRNGYLEANDVMFLTPGLARDAAEARVKELEKALDDGLQWIDELIPFLPTFWPELGAYYNKASILLEKEKEDD